MKENTLAVICCQGSDSIHLLDIEERTIRGEIKVGRHPVHASELNGNIFIATMDEREITVIKRDGEKDTIPTEVLGPSHFATIHDRLFVSCTGGDQVAVIDPSGLALERTIYVGDGPHELEIIRGDLYVGTRGSGEVVRIDPESMEVKSRFKPEIDSSIQGIDSFKGKLYAVNQAHPSVLSIDPENGVEGFSELGDGLYDLLATPDGVFVPCREENGVYRYNHDLESPSFTHTGDAATDIESMDSVYWVGHRKEDYICSLDRDRIDADWPSYHLYSFNEYLVCCHYSERNVSLINADAGSVVDCFEVGEHPLGVLFI